MSIFFIDDLRIYEDGDFENGNDLFREKYKAGDSSFINEIFEETHVILKLNAGEGYIIAFPKGLIWSE